MPGSVCEAPGASAGDSARLNSSPRGAPCQPPPPPPGPASPHLGPQVASTLGCSWTLQARGSRPESPSRPKCPPHAAQCPGPGVTLRRKRGPGLRVCVLRRGGGGGGGGPGAGGHAGSPQHQGTVTQGHGVHNTSRVASGEKSPRGRTAPWAHPWTRSPPWGALLPKATAHSATRGTGSRAPARPGHSR